MEDYDAIGEPQEDILVTLLEKNYSPPTFLFSVKNILGDSWKEDGAEIVKEFAPDLQERFNKYVKAL
jgi:hypothetical protein